jgi:copper chaperone
MEKTIEVQNLKCGGCASTIRKKLNSITGVSVHTIDVENATLHLAINEEVGEQTVLTALKEMGYPTVTDENRLGTKMKSYISCGMGKIQG